MSASGSEDEPLFPEDILGSERNESAAFADLYETFDNLAPHDQQAAVDSQLAIRAADLGILAELEAQGISEATELRTRLEGHDPESDPLRADLLGVAADISDAQYKTDDIAEQRRLKTLGSIAHAINAISTVRAVELFNATTKQKPALLAYAQGQILGADVSEETRAALTALIATQ